MGLSILDLDKLLVGANFNIKCNFGFYEDEDYAYCKKRGVPGWLVVPTNKSNALTRCHEEHNRETIPPAKASRGLTNLSRTNRQINTYFLCLYDPVRERSGLSFIVNVFNGDLSVLEMS